MTGGELELLPLPHQRIGEPLDLVAQQQLGPPLRGNRFDTVERPRQLAVQGARGVRIVTEIHRLQEPITEVVRAVEGPQGRFQGLDDVSAASDLRRIPSLEDPDATSSISVQSG